PGRGRSPGEGNGYPLQYSCLENPGTEEPGSLVSSSLTASLPLPLISWTTHRSFYLSLLCSPLREPHRGGTGDAEPVTGAFPSLLIAGISDHTWLADTTVLNYVLLFVIPWTVAHQAPPFMGFSREEHWSEVVNDVHIYGKLRDILYLLLTASDGHCSPVSPQDDEDKLTWKDRFPEAWVDKDEFSLSSPAQSVELIMHHILRPKSYHSIVSDSLRPHGLQHARLPCSSLSPGVYPNSYPLSWSLLKCHLLIYAFPESEKKLFFLILIFYEYVIHPINLYSHFDNIDSSHYDVFKAINRVGKRGALSEWSRASRRRGISLRSEDSEPSMEFSRPEYWSGDTVSWKMPPCRNLHEFLGLAIALTFSIVFGVIVYRITTAAALSLNKATRSNVRVTVTATAVIINLVVILILDEIYGAVAKWLTKIEVPKTEQTFEERLILKAFLLKFVNAYSPIFYVAFFKGRFVGRPGSYVYVFDGYRMEECAPGGCLMELCIQLSIIMLGKQLIQNNIFEIGVPKLKKLFRKLKDETESEEAGSAHSKHPEQWDLDYSLEPYTGLTPEYMEMRIWFDILSGIGKFSVIINAFVIAVTSDFIPRLVYQYSYSHNGTLHGFVNHTLSFFNVSQLKEGTQPENSQFEQEVQFCRFKDYREPPWAPNPYEFSKQYWAVLSARLAFVIIFQNLVMFLSVLVDWMIPDIPTDISDQIKREKSLFVDFFLKEEHEKLRLTEEPAQRSQSTGRHSRRSPAASPAPSGRSQPGSSVSSGSQHTSV
ncbi:hypothetical protein FD755_000418, partial [Muntiacus reevesi]